MTCFSLKIIAIIMMFCNHYGIAIKHENLITIGAIAFPIFAFLITEGYVHTKSVKKYLSRLTIFAIISQIPFYLFNMKFLNKTTLSLNVFFTLALGLISIIIYDNLKKSQNKILHKEILNVKISTIISFIIMLSISLFSELINADYGYFGIFVIFFFYFFKEDKMKMIICYMLLCISWYTILIKEYGSLTFYIGNCIFRISSIIFISAYNGKLGNKIKWIFYIFYPAHLMFLYFFV